MADNPTVCCVMLTADRPEMARRVVECFRAQNYPRERMILLVADSGQNTQWSSDLWGKDNEGYLDSSIQRGRSVGELRNTANACSESDILIHFDDDDFSHPNRIAEQVVLLQASGAEAVGYREMLFWRDAQRHLSPSGYVGADGDKCKALLEVPGEAWLYSNQDPRYCLGTSLCYWRETWERKPFPATSQGEDTRWLQGLKTVGFRAFNADPSMIARIHPGNTSNAYRPEVMKLPEWRRVPEWDAHCRKVFEPVQS